MISNEQIKNTIEDCAKHKHIVTVRDIAYALLCLQLEDSLIAYKCIFGNDYDYNQEYHNTYDQTAMMSYLKTYVEVSLISGRGKRKDTEDISFEENKAYILKLKKDTEEAIEKKEIDKKDGLKILAQLSTTLNDKFNVKENSISQYIVVNQKYNALCECGREIFVPTKEMLMEKYKLVEKEE